MRFNWIFILLILMFLLPCCSSLKNEQDTIAIRYVQLSLLYNYMIQTSPDASQLQQQYKELQSKLGTMNEVVDGDERKNCIEKLNSINKEMEKQKKIFLTDIQQAVATVAKRKGYTIILGGGDTVVYARDGYDITNEVLKEVVATRLQKSPVTR
jgi:Skp family chaperone for outer membrane proteins